MTTYQQTKQLLHLIVRVPKEHSAFLYFNLESHEGLAFYSTLDSSLKELFRDIELFAPIEWDYEIRHLLEALKVPYHLITDEIVTDSSK